MKTILVPGGAGFIGSHTLRTLKASGYNVIALDNLSNGHRDSIENTVELLEGDIRDRNFLNTVFKTHSIDAVIHFAAFIEAGESVKAPLAFYENNVAGSLTLLNAMKDAGVDKIVFSSTAAVYGQPENNQKLLEGAKKHPINPYGDSKWMVECMLRDGAAAYGLKSIALRYFNAAGSAPDGGIGERHDPETHLIPLVLDAAMGVRPSIKIFGNDYDTPDGTCIRDYIHVCDLADAHVRALDHLFALDTGELDTGNSASDTETNTGFYDAFNLGNGKGFSVRQVIDTVKEVTGTDFTVENAPRRAGDPAFLVADATKARNALNWRPQYSDLADMVRHAYAFRRRHSSFKAA
ncbi:UDP-glucose 4-epimerase GalE [Kordiimonas sp. SCSIO 12610]|uniref:UDP-glucose 4-epimerase GalE n=1 Tax=Kordiimonas sp. SCSIO 12610 TaxID=2829597 RepID=UPI00210CC8F3|nr:UDP-glucose 4-epimerase GalE [Kordiimonas sp. SCSIO 12610]UTW56259.1 UDP-glucose 4-epimerase GalE [Kordiimonas sp. SCSIO 12610]